MTLTNAELQRFVDGAHDIIEGYVDNLPDGVSIDPAEGVIVDGPLRTVIECDSSVYVLAWIEIPKSYEFLDRTCLWDWIRDPATGEPVSATPHDWSEVN